MNISFFSLSRDTSRKRISVATSASPEVICSHKCSVGYFKVIQDYGVGSMTSSTLWLVLGFDDAVVLAGDLLHRDSNGDVLRIRIKEKNATLDMLFAATNHVFPVFVRSCAPIHVNVAKEKCKKMTNVMNIVCFSRSPFLQKVHVIFCDCWDITILITCRVTEFSWLNNRVWMAVMF